jgi:hypothetical protein
VKDHLGVALTMNDLPANIVLASKGAIVEWSSLGTTFSNFGNLAADHDKQNQDRYKDLTSLMNTSGKGETRGGDQIGVNTQSLSNTSPISSVFDSPWTTRRSSRTSGWAISSSRRR